MILSILAFGISTAFSAPLVPPIGAMGALGLTPSGLARVQAASLQVAQAGFSGCGSGVNCTVSTGTTGGGSLTRSLPMKFLLTVCNAAGSSCGGVLVTATGSDSEVSGGCPVQFSYSNCGSAGETYTGYDGQDHTDTNSAGNCRNWSVWSSGFMSCYFDSSNNPTQSGRSVTFDREFTLDTDLCTYLDPSPSFTQSGGVTTGIVSGRRYQTYRSRRYSKCGGMVLRETYMESSNPNLSVVVNSVEAVPSPADYTAGAAGAYGLEFNLGTPLVPNSGWNGLEMAQSSTSALGFPGLGVVTGNTGNSTGAGLSHLQNAVTLDTGDYYLAGPAVPKSAIQAAVSTSPVVVAGANFINGAQVVTGVVTVTGTVHIEGTVTIANGVLPSAVAISSVSVHHTFASEYSRVMVKYATAPIFGLAGKFGDLGSSLSTATLQTEFCFSLEHLGSHCVDLAGSGVLIALEVMKFFMIGGAFVMGIMFILG